MGADRRRHRPRCVTSAAKTSWSGGWTHPGRWAGGFRAWDEHGVYLATGRGVTDGRMLRVPADALRERSDAWFPFGGAPHRGAVPDRAQHRVDGAAARVPRHPRHARRRPRARDQQPGRRGHPGRRRARGREPSAAVVARPARPRRDLGRPVHRARRAAPRDRAAGRRRWTRWPSPTARRRCRLARPATASSGDWVIAPPLAAAGVDVAWCERAAAVLDGDGARSPAWNGSRARCRRRRCSPR